MIELCPAATVQNAYDKSPLFDASGWAFSGSGALASSVVVSAGPNPLYLYGRLYTISISESNKIPNSASMALTEEGYVWAPPGSAHLKVPDYANGRVVSYDLRTGQSSAPQTSYTGPVGCWYSGETLKVVRVKRDSALNTYDNPPPSPPSDQYEQQYGTWEVGTWQEDTMAFSSPALPSAPSRSSNTTSRRWIIGLYETYGLSERMDLSKAGEAENVKIDDTTMTSETTAVADVLVLPLDDREGVIHVRDTFRTVTGTQFITGNLAWNGDYYFNCSASSHCITTGSEPGEQKIGALCGTIKDGLYPGFSVRTGELVAIPDAGQEGCMKLVNLVIRDTAEINETNPLSDTQSDTFVGAAYAPGLNAQLTVSAADWVKWSRTIEDVTYQGVIIVSDAAATPIAIYSHVPHESGVLGSTLSGGGPYPEGDLQRIYATFIGQP